MSGSVVLIGSWVHPPTMTRRSPFGVRVALGASGLDNPPARWRVDRCPVPGCRKTHDDVRVAFRRPRSGEQVGGVVFLDQIAEPLADPNASYPHPREVRVSLT